MNNVTVFVNHNVAVMSILDLQQETEDSLTYSARKCLKLRNEYLAQRIQQPIPNLQTLQFNEFS